MSSTYYNGMSNNRSQSSDGESLPDDVFHDDTTVGGPSYHQAPPTSSSAAAPPKPPRVSGGSKGIASFINNNPKKIREILKRTNSDGEADARDTMNEGSKFTSDARGGGGREWSFKGGQGTRQQSVPVDVYLARSKGVDSPIVTDYGSGTTGLTSFESCISGSMSVSPQPIVHDDIDNDSTTETTPTNNGGLHPPRHPASSSTQSSTVDLETVHEGVESTPPISSSSSQLPPAKPGRQSQSSQASSGSVNESKPSPSPKQQARHRTKLYSDSQVLADDIKKKSTNNSLEEEDSKKPGRNTLERDNMLLREQLKLLKGENKKLRKENKKIRSKLHDSEEWDEPTSSSSHSESASSFVASPGDSTRSSHASSRVPSESPVHEDTETTRLCQKSESPSVGSSPKKQYQLEETKLGKETSLSRNLRTEGENKNEKVELSDDELGDLPGSLPTSVKRGGGIGIGAATGIRSSSVPSMFSTTSKSKPVPIPRSTTVSVGGTSDVVKSSITVKTTHGFELKEKSLDSDAIPTNIQMVKLEGQVTKPDSPVPKPRSTTSPSRESDVVNLSIDDKKGGKLPGSDDSNKTKERDKLNARKTLESLLPHLPSKQQMVTKPTPLPRSMSAREDEASTTTKDLPLKPRAASTSSVIRKVGTVTLGIGAKTTQPAVVLEEEENAEIDCESVLGVGGSDIVDRGEGVVSRSGEVKTVGESTKGDSVRVGESGEEDERTASVSSVRSFTSSTSSIAKGPITKPLPPKPSPPVVKSSPTKPLPLTPPTTTKPLPPTPSSSNSKPLPSTPSSSTKPLPLTPPTIAKPLPPTPTTSSTTKPLPPATPSSDTKPLPPTPPTPSSSSTPITKPLPPTPINVGMSSTSSPLLQSTSSPPTSAGIKELSGSISPKTPTARATGTGYKKVTIQSDTSWINRRKQAEKESTDSPLEPPPTPGGTSGGQSSRATGGSVSSTSGSQSPATSRSHAPYRSHSILPGPSPTASKSFLSPGTSFGGTPNTAELKPVPTTKLPPPKLLSARARTESVTDGEQQSKKSGSRGSEDSALLRSTSEENITSLASAKVKGQSKGGLFSKSKKDALLPKKPAKAWLRGKEKGSTPTGRPMSALITNNPSDDSRNFTGSCNVSTMPRGLPPEDSKYSPKSGRRKKAASEQDLSNGSPGRKSKGLLGRFKTRHAGGAPPLEEEPEDDASDSSSDDEKGGTIKFKPKLRHVAVKKITSFDDDSEPEYHQLFEYVFVVGLKEKPGASNKGKLTTELTYNFPPASDSAKKDMALQSIPQFCFPDVDQWKPVKEYKSESFSFVLTDMEGHRRFGYCRRLLPQGTGKRLPEVYCIVSPLGCFSLYEKILDHVEKRSQENAVSVFTFLKAIVANPFPRPGRSVQVPVISARGGQMETVVFERPMDSRLEHVDFSLLFNTLSQRKVIQVFSSLLMERRVILCAQSLSLLSGCAHALLALLYPFEWQHVFIPVLPGSLIDFVCSPLPYIIGINPSCIKQIESMETMEEALIVDLDKKKFVRKIGDETSILPTKLFQYLEHSLSSPVVSGEYSKKSSDAALRGRADQIVVNTFMTFFAYLYGDYKSFLSSPSGGEREFKRKDFVKKFSSKSTRRFLEAFQMTQMFENFIEQRENPNKEAMVAESLFERKIPDLSLGCQEIEIFSSKSRFDRWRIKKGFAKNN